MDKDNKQDVWDKPQSKFSIDDEHEGLRSEIKDWSGKTVAAIKNKLNTVNKLVKH